MRKLIGVAALTGALVLGATGVADAQQRPIERRSTQYPPYGGGMHMEFNYRFLTILLGGYHGWSPIQLRIVPWGRNSRSYQNGFGRNVGGYSRWAYDPAEVAGATPTTLLDDGSTYPLIDTQTDGDGVATVSASLPQIPPGSWAVEAEGVDANGAPRLLGTQFVLDPSGTITVIPSVAEAEGVAPAEEADGSTLGAMPVITAEAPAGGGGGLGPVPWIAGAGIVVAAAGVGVAGIRKQRSSAKDTVLKS